MILQEHYEFRCECPKCAKDSRALLKMKARSRGKEHLQNTSRLAREQYMHAHVKGGSRRGSNAISRSRHRDGHGPPARRRIYRRV